MKQQPSINRPPSPFHPTQHQSDERRIGQDPAITFQWFLLGARNPALLAVSRLVIHDRHYSHGLPRHPGVRHCASIVLAFATIAKQVHVVMKEFIAHAPHRLGWMLECLVREPTMEVQPDAFTYGKNERDFICLIMDRPATRPAHVWFGQEFFCVDQDYVPLIEAIHQFAHLEVDDEASFKSMMRMLEWLNGD
jgi:hypothetical protein